MCWKGPRTLGQAAGEGLVFQEALSVTTKEGTPFVGSTSPGPEEAMSFVCFCSLLRP